MRKLLFAAFVFAACLASPARAAGPLDSAFVWVDAGTFGLPKDAVKGVVTPIYDKDSVIVAADEIAGRKATVNYLFNPAGKLYGTSWYVLTPVSDIQTAADLHELVKATLNGKYGGGKRLSGSAKIDGNKVREVLEKLPKLAAAREGMHKLTLEKKAAGAKPKPEEIKAILGDLSPLDVIPSLFHVEENMWDGKTVRVYASLLCSTDGTCYEHINFVSKDLTRSEDYPTTSRKPFSYHALDRDQDKITAVNKELPLGAF